MTSDVVTISRTELNRQYKTINMQRRLLRAESLVNNQARELHTLNEVIACRKRHMRRMRDYIHAIKAIHAPLLLNGAQWCDECASEWPCRTLLAGQPQDDK